MRQEKRGIIRRGIGFIRRRHLLDWMPDAPYLKLVFFEYMGKRLNLRNPQTFNEKLQWLKLYDRKPEYTRMVDKYEAKKYVAERIGEGHIIPTYGVWDRFEDIDFDSLPDQFVLKCTHDCGGLVICRDKSKLNMDEAKNKIESCLRRDYYSFFREWPYKNVKPRIIAERYMEDAGKEDLPDYKVMCFNGTAKLIQYHTGRFSEHKQDYYDRDWTRLDIKRGMANADEPVEKPKALDEMLALSEALASNCPELRVDWYHIGEHMYFGELTFFDGSGTLVFEPEEWDKRLGEWIRLPKPNGGG